MREWLLAALLAVAGSAVVVGVAHFATGAAWIVAGALLAAWSWLLLGEVDG